MAKKTESKSAKNTRIAVEVGAGVAAAAALAGAGYYFYASKDAKKHRKVVAKWADGMKKEVIREAKKLKKIDAKEVARVVDTAARAYEDVSSIKKSDVRNAAKELKSNWDMLMKEAKISIGGMPAKKAAKKVAKVAKKAVKSAKKR